MTDADVMVSDFAVDIPADIEEQLVKAAHEALMAITAATRSGYFIAGLSRIEADVKLCLENKYVSRLRHLLSSYPVRKCLQIVDDSKKNREGKLVT